ncbi:MAG: rane protein [Pseudomonas sp.]|nr:rane protein [Pseudomonas sp.]
MSMIRVALPLILLTSVLAGCADLQKTDWPMCAAVGGVTGAGLGAIQNGTYAGYGALIGGGVAAAYCWVHGGPHEKCPGTPKGVPVDADGCPLPAPPPVAEPVVEAPVVKEETIVINDVYFKFDSAQLTPADKQKLDLISTRLKKEAPSAQLRVSGHTDSVGSDKYNKTLSQKRAASVTNYLVASGIPRNSFVAVVGEGESRPVADNKTAEGRALNRRVEIKINR